MSMTYHLVYILVDQWLTHAVQLSQDEIIAHIINDTLEFTKGHLAFGNGIFTNPR